MRNSAKRSLTLALLGLLALPPGPAAADDDYRLTGIMGSDTGMAFAVIESVDGQQQLLREGSAIGPGHVKSISARDKTVVLVFPTGELELRLKGSGMPNEFQEELTINDFYNETAQQSLDPGVVAKLLALAGTAEKIDEKQLILQVNKLLGLPEQAQIAGYDGQLLDSTHALLEQLGARISGMSEQDDFLGTIAVSDQDGHRRVYLSVETAPAR